MVKVSLIGAGKISEHYIKVLQSFKKVKIVGIVSKSLKSSKIKSKKFNIPYFGNSIDLMMKKLNPNIVIVCVTPSSVTTTSVVEIYGKVTLNVVVRICRDIDV